MTTAEVPNSGHSNARLVWTCLGAFAVAAMLLVLFVLPAEFAIDPLGTGKLLGLTDLSGQQSDAITHQSEIYHRDSREFVLSPFESLEYKYRIEEGGVLIYSWHASGEVLYDFHAEPDGSEPGFAESFDKQRKEVSHGSYFAAFSGIHGWYWENRGNTDVVIKLESTGFYSGSIEFRDGLETEDSFTTIGVNSANRGTEVLVK